MARITIVTKAEKTNPAPVRQSSPPFSEPATGFINPCEAWIKWPEVLLADATLDFVVAAAFPFAPAAAEALSEPGIGVLTGKRRRGDCDEDDGDDGNNGVATLPGE